MANYDTNIGSDKTKTAVALQYEHSEDIAPRIVSTGKGALAEQILALAKANNIPIHEDAELSKILSMLEVNSFIPIEVYAVVAEILSYIYKQNNKSNV